MDECVTSAAANIDEVVAVVAPKMKVSETALKAALRSKRLTFDPMSMQSARGRDTILGAADYLYRTA
jgi:hypothetical protein